MACPFFYPDAPLDASMWEVPPRYPLGIAYGGTCRAPASASFFPDAEQLREVCNYGYARGRCPRFPEASRIDAFRFSMAEHSAALIWIAEAEHLPVDHGVLEPEETGDDALHRQARAFRDSLPKA